MTEGEREGGCPLCRANNTKHIMTSLEESTCSIDMYFIVIHQINQMTA